MSAKRSIAYLFYFSLFPPMGGVFLLLGVQRGDVFLIVSGLLLGLMTYWLGVLVGMMLVAAMTTTTTEAPQP